MIQVKGNKAIFTGKDARVLKNLSKDLGLSVQDLFTGMMWEYIMKLARQQVFKK